MAQATDMTDDTDTAKQPQHGSGHHFWLVNVILVIAVLLAWWVIHNRDAVITPKLDVKDMSYALNAQGLQYVGADSSLDPFEETLFGGGISIKRGYRAQATGGADEAGSDSARTLWLLLVQTFDDRHAHHPPEYCYTGSGWEIRSSEPGDWTLANGQRPILALAERIPPGGELERELVVYWFTDGKRFADSYFKRTLLDTWDRIRGNRSSWVMVRLSAQVKPDTADLEQAKQSLQRFSQSVYTALEAS